MFRFGTMFRPVTALRTLTTRANVPAAHIHSLVLPKGWNAVKQIPCNPGRKFISFLDHPNDYQGKIIVYSPAIWHDTSKMKIVRAEMQSRQCGLALFTTTEPCFAWLRLCFPESENPLDHEYLIDADHLTPTKELEASPPLASMPTLK